MFSSTSPATVRSKAGAILRVTSGNFLEQFDFFLFGFYATYIAHTFFPASSEFASLMMTFAVFGAGFLMRPIGAIVLGAYIDKVGRRKGLIVTLSIMAAGTFLIVLIPGLLWNFLRPAEYMASARIQITPGGALPQQPPQPGSAPEGAGSGWAETELLTQVQKLTSRPLLEKVAETLRIQGHPLPDGDAPVQLQEMIRAVPVNGTEVVELQAVGTRPEQLAAALNGLVEASRGEMKTSYDAAASESLAQAMGGDLSLAPPGEEPGAEFHLQLPLAQQP